VAVVSKFAAAAEKWRLQPSSGVEEDTRRSAAAFHDEVQRIIS
jgi:hypothetical protein